MGMISVRTLPGRVAFDAPRGGKPISSTDFTIVADTPYVRRLLDHWGDIELLTNDPQKKAAPPPAAAPVAAKPADTKSA